MRQHPSRGVPVRERASEASLRQRLTAVLDDNRTLREENRALRYELEVAYGAQRQATAW